jgi:bifunctional non-homologous end joining protein LigD
MIEHPDQLVFDLDPGAGNQLGFVVEAAVELRLLLRHEELESWPKVTGGKGLHVMVAIERGITHDAARIFRIYCKRLTTAVECRCRSFTSYVARRYFLFLSHGTALFPISSCSRE